MTTIIQAPKVAEITNKLIILCTEKQVPVDIMMHMCEVIMEKGNITDANKICNQFIKEINDGMHSKV